MLGKGRGRGGRDCELVALLLEWILFNNILFLRKLFYVAVFMASEREKSQAGKPDGCS